MPPSAPLVTSPSFVGAEFFSRLNWFTAEFIDPNVEQRYRQSELRNQRIYVVLLCFVASLGALTVNGVLVITYQHALLPLHSQQLALILVVIGLMYSVVVKASSHQLDRLIIALGVLILVESTLLRAYADPQRIALVVRIMAILAVGQIILPTRFVWASILAAVLAGQGLELTLYFLTVSSTEKTALTVSLIFLWLVGTAARWQRETSKRRKYRTTEVLASMLREHQSSESKMRLINDNLPIFIAYINQQYKLQFANQTGRIWYQSTETSMKEFTLRQLFAEDAEVVQEHAEAALSGKQVHFEQTLCFPDGCVRCVDVRFFPHIDKDTQVLGFVSQITDVTGIKQIQQELIAEKQLAERLARTDELTGLNNRRAFFEQGNLLYQQSARHHRDLSLLMLDIDHFKRINDQYGHAVGDVAIKAVAQEIKQTLRAADVVARVGGEEFAAVLFETDMAAALLLAERVRVNIAALQIDTGADSVMLTVSIGVSWATDACPNGEPPVDYLLKQADTALYTAKTAGRNQVMSQS